MYAYMMPLKSSGVFHWKRIKTLSCLLYLSAIEMLGDKNLVQGHSAFNVCEEIFSFQFNVYPASKNRREDTRRLPSQMFRAVA